MGASIGIGLLLMGAGAAASNKLAPKPDAPPPMPRLDDPADDPAVQEAAKRQRKKNVAAYGRSDTILTGTGQNQLGMMPSGSSAPKTLLGG